MGVEPVQSITSVWITIVTKRGIHLKEIFNATIYNLKFETFIGNVML